MSSDTGVGAAEYPSHGDGLAARDLGRLLLRCADRPGLVAAVSAFLTGAGANIVSLDQHSTSPSGGTFMQRTIFHLPDWPRPATISNASLPLRWPVPMRSTSA